MTQLKTKDLKDRANKAWEKRRLYDQTLREIYDFMLPFRDVTGLYLEGGRSEGQTRVDKVFDGNAIKAAFRFAGRLQTELTPIFQTFFTLEAGPLLPDDDNKKVLTEELQKVGRIVAGVLSSGAFHQRAHEMYLDLFAGTGAMCIMRGDDREPVRYMTASIAEIALELGPYGDVWGIVWKRQFKAGHIKQAWPKGKFGDELAKVISDKPDDDRVIIQYTYFDPEASRWRLAVYDEKAKDDEEPFWTEAFRTCPWLTPRFFVVPGEPYGRGPAHIGLPFAKTLNKARELALKAAAFAVLGLWMYRSDAVFNPDTVRYQPGSMWKVASTGGPMGPSIARLPVPENFDVTSIVIEDEREQMKLALFDDTLPPDSGAVRSATEITERMRRLSQDLAGVFGRLTLEIVVPLVQRVIDILEESGKLNTNITIDQLLTQVRVVAPIAAGQQAAKVDQAVSWLEILGMLFGPEAAMLAARVEELGPYLGRWLGVEERFIRSAADRQQWMQAMAAFAATQQQAAQAAKQETAPASQQYVNGGAM